MSKTRTRTEILAVLCMILACVCCASPSPSPDAPAGQPSAASNGSVTPEFSGKHKDLVSELWQKVDSAGVREMLLDEVITDFEWQNVTENFKQCVSSYGMTVTDLSDLGGFTVKYNRTPKSTDDEEIDGCKTTSGLLPISILRAETQTNQDTTDQAILMSECLIRARVVAASYSAEDWRRDSHTTDKNDFDIEYTVPESTGVDAMLTCNTDPTGSYR